MYLNVTENLYSSMNGTDHESGVCGTRLLTIALKTQPIFLLIFGFVANLCSFIVLIRRRLRRRPTFSYLAFLSLSNSLLSLIHASLTILGIYFGFTVDDLPLFIFCRLLNRFSVDFLTHFSLYTLTAVDLDRIRTVTSTTNGNNRNSRTHRGRQHGCAKAFIRVCLIELFLALVLFFLNIHWLTSYGYIANGSNKVTCTIPDLDVEASTNLYALAYKRYLVSILPFIELVLFNVIPFLVSLIATVVILRHVSIKYSLLNHTNKRLKKSRRRMELHLSILLISLNCVFILFTTPHTLYTIYLGHLQRHLDMKSEIDDELCSLSITQKSLDLLQQCYFMSTFFLYILTNKRFREEFYELLKRNFFRSCRQHANHSLLSNVRTHYHNCNTNEIQQTKNLELPEHHLVETRFSVTDYLSQDDYEDSGLVSTSKCVGTNEMSFHKTLLAPQ